jgi:hypothetical protein
VDLGRESLVPFLEYPSGAGKEGVTAVHDGSLVSLLAYLRHAVIQKLTSYTAPHAVLSQFPLTPRSDTLAQYFYLHKKATCGVETEDDGDTLVGQDTAGPDGAPKNEPEEAVRSLWAPALCLKATLPGVGDFIRCWRRFDPCHSFFQGKHSATGD